MLVRCMVLIKLDAAETAEMLEAFRMVTVDGNSKCDLRMLSTACFYPVLHVTAS